MSPKTRLAISVAAGLLIAGCGSDDDDALSKAEFLKQGNAICKKGNEQIDAAGSKAFAGGEPTEAELTELAEKSLVPIIQGEIDELNDLSPPEEDEAQVESILNQAQATLDEIKAEPELVATEDTFAAVNRKAKTYGLIACAQ